MNRFHIMTVSIMASAVAAVSVPVARAEDSVTYEIVSDNVPVLAGVEYRDVGGKKLLPQVPLPWQITVPVIDAFSPTDDGAELRADWRPNFRTAATVGRVLQGEFVTVRISFRGKVICESRMDVGNATCYGSASYKPDSGSSYDRGPLFPEQPGFSP